jgi:hypothetical protein
MTTMGTGRRYFSSEKKGREMSPEVVFVLVIAGVVAYGILAYKRSTQRLTVLYGEELRAYNAAAFTEIVEDSPDEHFSYVTRLAREVESKRNQRAIPVQTLERGTAIHHINQNGTFSAKGPYFISWRSGHWRETGRVHLVKVLRGKGSWGVAPDHYNQRGVIKEKGVLILEYNTERYPPLDIRDFARRKAR